MIVEDGSIVAGANSYVTTAYFENYWLERNADLSGCSTTQIEAALIIATQYLDNNYGFAGDVASDTQELSWPRTSVYNKNGVLLASDSIPKQVMGAVCEFAKRQLDADLQPVVSSSGIVESESKSLGSLSKSVTYIKGSQYTGAANVPAADMWLSGLTYGGRLGNFGRMMR